MSTQSAGILVYRRINTRMEVLLVHPGGPFWKNKDYGAWSIPKGEFNTTEEPLAAAIREFTEETGFTLKGKFFALGASKLKSGKLIHAWAHEGDLDVSKIKSNNFEMEWPPHSKKMQSFPEIDKAGWFLMEDATVKINPGQLPFLAKLEEMILK